MTRIGAGAGIAALTVGAFAGVANAVGSAHKGDEKGKGPVAVLITEGTLTAAQATAVRDALKATREAGRADHLRALVTAGTITQAQADALSDKGGLRGLIQSGDMTREEVKELHDAVHETDKPDMEGQFESVINKLVAAGTITQAQADALIAAKPAKPAKIEKGPKGDHAKHGGIGGPGEHGAKGDHGPDAGNSTANGSVSSVASA